MKYVDFFYKAWLVRRISNVKTTYYHPLHVKRIWTNVNVKNDYRRSCEFSCRVFICNICFVNLNSNTITFLSPPDDDYNSNYGTDSDSYSDSDSGDEVLETLILDDNNDLQRDKRVIYTNSNELDKDILEYNNIEDFLM